MSFPNQPAIARDGPGNNRVRLDADHVRQSVDWRNVLQALGVDPAHLNGKHHPCPHCGGTDRFRFDNKGGSGSYICGQCGAGDGFSLAAKRMGLDPVRDFSEVVRRVADVGGIGGGEFRPTARVQTMEPAPTPNLKVWQRIKAIAARVIPLSDPAADPARRYLINRGLNDILTDLPDPAVIGCHPALPHWHEGKMTGHHPAIVARVQRIDVVTMGLHCTYLSVDGTKADVSAVKKLTPKLWDGAYTGAAVRLYPMDGDTLHLTEGIESAFAVRLGSGGPAWACLTAGALEAVQIPRGVRSVCVWGDLDASGTGQRAARALADRLAGEGRSVRVLLPPGAIPEGAKGLDWLDVWTQRGRI
ncbi:MAG: toprim domain-containing protein [Magnetococcales bacterium]|nr:toprim domain-containing protein [Magnetococcales bacterium]MBF0115999.1 toprim domain-containing protein [Magnetococcales bacterium]